MFIDPIRAEFEEGGKTRFKVFILYQDFASGSRAMRMVQSLSGRLGNDFIFEHELWKFDVLQLPGFKQFATEQLTEADMIMIAARGESELPSEVKNWIEQALVRSRKKKAALVGLSYSSPDSDHESSMVNSYLGSVAQRANLDFFAHEVGGARESEWRNGKQWD